MKTPPLLIGASLLFWGWQTGYIVIGIIIAIALEGSRLIKRRWEFSPQDFYRIADLCALIFIGMYAYRFIADTASNARWLPMGLFPLLLGQSFSTVGGVDLGAFLFTARKKERKREVKARRTIDVAFPSFILILHATSAANIRTPLFYAGMFFLIGWALLSVRPRRTLFILWIFLFFLAGGLGWTGQIGLYNLHKWLENTTYDWYREYIGQDQNPFQSMTAIGDIGKLKLSNRIIMRVWAKEKSFCPDNLLKASYNKYWAGRWLASGTKLIEVSPEGEGTTWRIGEKPKISGMLTVSHRLRNGKGILSLPGYAYQIENLPVSSLERSRFGVTIAQGGPGLVTYQVRFGFGSPYNTPFDDNDIAIPAKELSTVRQIAEELKLAVKTPQDVVKTLHGFFQKRFKYSLKLERSAWGKTPIQNFLLKSRSGHCEFFATATVFLLRAAGIPARYANGYAVDEFSRLEECYVVRDRHAHAWTLAYIDGAWRDVDTTPASWLEIESQDAPSLEPLYDFFRWIGYSFSLWRWGEREGWLPKWMALLIVPLAIIMVWRILFRRRAASIKAIKQKNIAQKRSLDTESTLYAESAFYQIEKSLARQGFPRRSWETHSTFIQRIEASRAGSTAVVELKEMLAIHYRMRFHPEGIGKKGVKKLRERVEAWLARYNSDVGLWSTVSDDL